MTKLANKFAVSQPAASKPCNKAKKDPKKEMGAALTSATCHPIDVRLFDPVNILAFQGVKLFEN
jgi:hypothetical protein